MRRGIPLGILLALVIATGAGGYTFYDLGIGGRVYTGSARGSAMGETGWLSEENAFSTMLNPATLSILGAPEIEIAYQYNFLQETRAFPAYDSFDALLGYNIYTANKNYYQNIAVGFATGAIPRARGLCLGVMYSPVYDFNYGYEEEVRDRTSSSQPADELLARAYIIGEGTLNALSFGAAMPLADEAAVGVSVDYVFGSYDLIERVAYEGGLPETRDTHSASKQGGVRLRMGGRIEVGERLELGFEATTSCEMTGDFEVLSDSTVLEYADAKTTYPASFGIGVRFKPRNELRGHLEVGMNYIGWSNYESDFYGDLDLDNVYSWHAGVEHVFYNGMPLRFGLIYTNSPEDEDIKEAAFTFGTGLEAYGWTVDFSGRIGWQKYRYPDLFDDEMFGVTSREEGLSWRDEVRETSFSGRLSFARSF